MNDHIQRNRLLARQIHWRYDGLAVGVYCIWKLLCTVGEVYTTWNYTQRISFCVSTVTQCCFKIFCNNSYLKKGEELQVQFPHRPSLPNRNMSNFTMRLKVAPGISEYFNIFFLNFI
jgi:hypothetical protein